VNLKALASLLARNWRLKLSALGLAIFLWALVQVDGSELRTVALPVSVQLNEPGWIVVGQPSPASVDIRFSGPAREVFRLGFEGSGVTIPMNQVSSGDTVVIIQSSWIPTQGFQGVQVEEIVPSTVRLRLEREETKVVPVRISTRGRIPTNLALTRSLGLNPDLVRATGPASLIEQLDSLDIVPVDLNEVTLADGELEALIDTEGFAGLKVVPDRVSLRVPVEESVRRVLTGLPVDAATRSTPSAWPPAKCACWA